MPLKSNPLSSLHFSYWDIKMKISVGIIHTLALKKSLKSYLSQFPFHIFINPMKAYLLLECLLLKVAEHFVIHLKLMSIIEKVNTPKEIKPKISQRLESSWLEFLTPVDYLSP